MVGGPAALWVGLTQTGPAVDRGNKTIATNLVDEDFLVWYNAIDKNRGRMMNTQCKIALLVGAGVLLLSGEVYAQSLFGSSVSRRSRPSLTTGDAGAGGADLKSARFVRQNRTAQNFVGAEVPATVQQRFVGATAAGEIPLVPSSVSDLRSLLAMAAVNRQTQATAATPATSVNNGLKPPRLQVSFEYSAPSSGKPPSTLLRQLESRPDFHAIGPIEVSLAGRTAIVRGTVASERDRFLAQQFLLFEPGISKVQNELRIQQTESDPTMDYPEAETSSAP